MSDHSDVDDGTATTPAREPAAGRPTSTGEATASPGNRPVDELPPAGAADARTLARNGSLNLVGVTLYGLANFAIVVLVTRRLGAGGAGAFLVAVGVFNILTTAAVLGADQGLLRFIARFRALDRTSDIRRTILLATVPVAVVAAVAGATVVVLAEPLSRLLSDGGRSDLTTYLRVMGLFIPLGAVYQALEGGSRGFATMLPGLVVDRIGRPLATLASMAVVLTSGFASTAVALAFVGPLALALVPLAWWTVVLVRRLGDRPDDGSPVPGATGFVDQAAPLLEHPPALDQPTGPAVPHVAASRPSPVGRSALAREFWRFSAPRALGGIFQIAIIWLDSLMVGALASTREAGVYAAATRWLIAGTFAGMAISLAFGPQISFVLAREEHRRANRLYQTATVWHMALAFPAYLTTMVFAPALLRAFGPGFESGATVMVVLGAANMFTAACGPINVVLLMAGRSSLSLMNNGLALAANIGLNLVLIPRYGIEGAAIAWTASLAMTNLLPLWQLRRHPGMWPFSRGWVTIAAIAAVGVVAVQLLVRLLLGPSLPGLATAVAATAVVYGALVHRFREPLDVDALLGGLRSRRGRDSEPSVQRASIR